MKIKLKHLKKMLDKLTPEQLNQPLYVNREDMGISGLVHTISKSRSDMFWDGSDDPSTLKTRQELREEGYDSEEIAGMDIEIPKGGFVLKF